MKPLKKKGVWDRQQAKAPRWFGFIILRVHFAANSCWCRQPSFDGTALFTILTVRNWVAGKIRNEFSFDFEQTNRFSDLYSAKLSETTDRQFKSTVQQQFETLLVRLSFAPSNCFQRSPVKFKLPFPLLTPPPPCLPPAAHPPAAHSPSSSTSICSTSTCTAATPSATDTAASWTVSSHAANSWPCHQLSHLLCHLLRRGAVQELARARVEKVVLEPCCIQPCDHLWAFSGSAGCLQLYSTVIFSSCCVSFLSNSPISKLLLTFLPLLICPPTTRPVVVLTAAGQARPSTTDPGPHDPLSLIAGGHVL